jgi:hypothetical protein
MVARRHIRFTCHRAYGRSRLQVAAEHRRIRFTRRPECGLRRRYMSAVGQLFRHSAFGAEEHRLMCGGAVECHRMLVADRCLEPRLEFGAARHRRM